MTTTFYQRFGKRILDLLLIIPGMILLSPVLVILSLVVHQRMGKPALFLQKRPGYQCKPFTVFKFRTMTDERGHDGNFISDRERLTNFGRFLRSTSLDELPELINVLKGDMSLVGPRPLLMEYLDLYTIEQMRRHEVKPGITGWAQINGRNALSWEKKFAYDIWYVDHQSLKLDLKILLLTIWRVIKREGISQPGQETMTAFRGAKQNE